MFFFTLNPLYNLTNSSWSHNDPHIPAPGIMAKRGQTGDCIEITTISCLDTLNARSAWQHVRNHVLFTPDMFNVQIVWL